MRSIGRLPNRIAALPSAEALREAALQHDIGKAMTAVLSTGIVKGVYRFRTHQEADAQRMEALVGVIAANASRQRRDLDGVPLRTLDIEGLLKTKRTSRDKDKLDRIVLERALEVLRRGATDG